MKESEQNIFNNLGGGKSFNKSQKPEAIKEKIVRFNGMKLKIAEQKIL